jgi:hypothetical protein
MWNLQNVPLHEAEKRIVVTTGWARVERNGGILGKVSVT